MDRYSFIGAGNMAYAIIGGMGKTDITVYDKNPEQYKKFSADIKIAPSPAKAVESADFIVLAVKPQNFKEVLAEIKDSGVSLDNKTFVSIAAGVTTESICAGLGQAVPVIRTMPNTPLLIGKGVTALSRNEYVPSDAFQKIFNMFSSIGEAFELPESKMNAVIAATSSAPAYIYYIIDCIAKEAKAEGVDSPEILKMVCAMVKGSADMIISSEKTPEELIRMVTSPNGTTERAMKVLSDNKLDETISEAMKACTKRAKELSKELQ